MRVHFINFVLLSMVDGGERQTERAIEANDHGSRSMPIDPEGMRDSGMGLKSQHMRIDPRTLASGD
jgi:hypothetical protein